MGTVGRARWGRFRCVCGLILPFLHRDFLVMIEAMARGTPVIATSHGRLRGGDCLDSQRMRHLCDLFRWIVANGRAPQSVAPALREIVTR